MGNQGGQTPYPYEVSDQPPELSDQDLAFISSYTGKDLDELRVHVISVWRAVKAKVHN